MVAGSRLFEILEIAGLRFVEQSALLEPRPRPTAGRPQQHRARTAAQSDRAADKAIARYATLADFTPRAVLDSEKRVVRNELRCLRRRRHVVMRPTPYSGASKGYESASTRARSMRGTGRTDIQSPKVASRSRGQRAGDRWLRAGERDTATRARGSTVRTRLECMRILSDPLGRRLRCPGRFGTRPGRTSTDSRQPSRSRSIANSPSNGGPLHSITSCGAICRLSRTMSALTGSS